MVDILLKSLLVLESFFSFFSSRFSSVISRLWVEMLRGNPPLDLDSLIRRPNDLQLLSDDDRGWLDEGDVGSILVGLLCLELLDEGRVDF